MPHWYYKHAKVRSLQETPRLQVKTPKLTRFESVTQRELCTEVATTLIQKGNDITIWWTPAHVGIDFWAKAAADDLYAIGRSLQAWQSTTE